MGFRLVALDLAFSASQRLAMFFSPMGSWPKNQRLSHAEGAKGTNRRDILAGEAASLDLV